MEETSFELDGLSGAYAGWHDRTDDWNGFANPLLSRDESERLAAALNAYLDDGPTYAVRHDEVADAFVVSTIEGGEVLSVDRVESRDVQGVGHVYDWGHGWCWWGESKHLWMA